MTTWYDVTAMAEAGFGDPADGQTVVRLTDEEQEAAVQCRAADADDGDDESTLEERIADARHALADCACGQKDRKQ